MKLSIFFLLAFPLTAAAQQMDSVRQTKKNWKYYMAHTPLKRVPKSTKLDFQIDTRNSFLRDFPVNVYGVNLGLVFRQRIRVGAGYYWINQNFNDKLLGIYAIAPTPQLIGKVIATSKGIPIPVSKLEASGKIRDKDFLEAAQQLNIWFASVGVMYTFYASRVLELSIPIEIGYGNFSEKLFDTSGNNFSILTSTLKPQPSQGHFIPGQIGFDVLVKVHRWAYFESAVGYRQTLSQTFTSKSRATSFDSQFDGTYYNLGVKVQIGTIMKEWKQRKKNKAAKKAALPVK